MNSKAIIGAALSVALCAGMSVTASAGENMNDALEAWLNGNPVLTYGGTYESSGSGASVRSTAREKPASSDAKDDGREITAPESDKAPGIDLESYAKRVLELTNQERETAGAPALEYNAALAEAAAIRAGEISEKFSHERPDGTQFYTVMGVERNYLYGENIAGDYRSPDDAAAGWMKSDGHRKNILRNDYIEIGIGVYQGADGSLTWVQFFSR